MPHEAENEMQRRMETLADRLESLERRTRWLRWVVALFGMGALIGAGGWLLGRMGTKPRSLPGVAEIVRTHRLVIVDQAGREATRRDGGVFRRATRSGVDGEREENDVESAVGIVHAQGAPRGMKIIARRG